MREFSLMSLRNTLFAALGLLCLVPVAQAQYYYTPSSPDSRPVQLYVMGGFNEPTGQTSDILQGGWDVGFGVAFRQPGSPLALRLEMNYAQNNATNQLINQGTAAERPADQQRLGGPVLRHRERRAALSLCPGLLWLRHRRRRRLLHADLAHHPGLRLRVRSLVWLLLPRLPATSSCRRTMPPSSAGTPVPACPLRCAAA